MSTQEENSHTLIKESHDRFHANVAALEKGQGAVPRSSLEQAATGAIPVAPVTMTPAAAAVEADRLQAAINPETGKRLYVEDSAYREYVENLRFQAMAGAAPIPVAGQPLATAPVEPADAGEGSGSERMLKHLESGGEIAQTEVNQETWKTLCADYVVNLKEGYVLNSAHVEMLHNARRSAISQDIVSRYIAEAIKE